MVEKLIIGQEALEKAGYIQKEVNRWENIADRIVIWTVKDTNNQFIDYIWKDLGSTSLTSKFGERRVNNIVLDEIKSFVMAGKLICCGCNCETSIEDKGGQYFAGVYCKECWEEFKAKNSRTCRICGSPQWRCYC